MLDYETILKNEGQVEAPEDFTERVLKKVSIAFKLNGLMRYFHSIWMALVISIFKSLDNFLSGKPFKK